MQLIERFCFVFFKKEGTYLVLVMMFPLVRVQMFVH